MKRKHLGQLKIYYLFIFILSAILIAPTHIFPQPYLMTFRFPYYLKIMRSFLGIGWPATFEIYHYVLYALVIIGSLNVLGILFYPRFKSVGIFSSMMGVFILSLMVLFFFFKFIGINASTAIVYGIYSLFLLIADLLTFKALIRQKEA